MFESILTNWVGIFQCIFLYDDSIYRHSNHSLWYLYNLRDTEDDISRVSEFLGIVVWPNSVLQGIESNLTNYN